MLEIRPHHFMCILGYKGLNYNPESSNNWTKIVNEIKSNPKIKFKMVLTEDSLCKECKHSGLKGGTCDKNFVKKIDDSIKKLLDLKEEKIYSFLSIKKALYKIMNSKIHEKICKDCNWWKLGLCRDTFEKS